MFESKILADSRSPEGIRLTTFQVTFPRFILAEVNTHRTFSRNSASSRAIPFAKQVSMINSDPFVPDVWPTEKKGMSGGDPLDQWRGDLCADEWEKAREDAVRHATRLTERGVHKSLANRLLEPFMWHTSIITATEFGNFFALRTDKDAQPEFRTIAERMQEDYWLHEPHPLDYGEWHLPLVSSEELIDVDLMFPNSGLAWAYWRKVSVGRCARVSYLTHDGNRDPEKDIELHDRLLKSHHLSPFEHVAKPFPGKYDYHANFRGFQQYRLFIPNERDLSKVLRLAA